MHIWYKWYWYNYHLQQYNISNKIHINPARSQPYMNPKYISFNNGIRGDNSGTFKKPACHYSDVIMITMTSQITGVLIVYSTVCSGTDQRKTSKFRVTSRYEGNSPVTGEFPIQRASKAENVSIWWRHYGSGQFCVMPYTLLAKSNGRFFVLDFWKLSNRRNVFNFRDNKDR